MIPLLHDFTGETVLVFGGGPVGARKARRFGAEASVVVVSPDFADRDFGAAELVREAPDADGVRTWVDRTDPALVVAATDDAELNAVAETAARERGALVNRADDHGEQDVGNVVVPATVRSDPVVMAVATGGHSPALSKHLRESFEDQFADAGEMAELSGKLREELKSTDMTPTERRDAVRTVVRSDEVWKALDSGRSKARQVAADVIGYQMGDTS
ncbi:precorrin-2 dehydrogenase/sirohydrochlorin ferrochelatase family protein [Haloarcula salinisoli]|uniref:precorrin-2 dehydrogenase n=1 Tax=Haloarcula salinisoli TaxID=2487746 RepID=A0A8J7YKL2_9EURY|nr:bifunctional precorrin-2 dehydrogenase/sirohydrochlorin ferrochelatase [Halomicroarcula salinisoli]MBX0287385.1 bifunctional precorrin-2 dehydrogenase/sirohydrochlorin ferrochelatase [Halomicroarcula salinisoli]MBX0305041.1 bifunctional precorrin-2 dehydrogenase/sirohydrochlorin ferrochelatase [Halomicroarcula salinisoli]